MENERKILGMSQKRAYEGIIILLILVIGALSVWMFTSRRHHITEQQKSELLQGRLQFELDSLVAQHNTIKLQYDSILVEKDSIIRINAEEISRLIAQQADYNRIRRQLNVLRQVTQSYVQEIDSLVRANQVLVAENVAMREEIQVTTARVNVLQREGEELRSKVEVASVLRGHGFTAQALRIRGSGREEATDRASRAEQIRVCFDIAENPVARAGEYQIFLRIAAPDGRILRLSDADAHSFVHNNDTLQFSNQTTINYQNRLTNVCMVWQRTEEFKPGTYLISVYSNEAWLGETTLSLR